MKERISVRLECKVLATLRRMRVGSPELTDAEGFGHEFEASVSLMSDSAGEFDLGCHGGGFISSSTQYAMVCE